MADVKMLRNSGTDPMSRKKKWDEVESTSSAEPPAKRGRKTLRKSRELKNSAGGVRGEANGEATAAALSRNSSSASSEDSLSKLHLLALSASSLPHEVPVEEGDQVGGGFPHPAWTGPYEWGLVEGTVATIAEAEAALKPARQVMQGLEERPHAGKAQAKALLEELECLDQIIRTNYDKLLALKFRTIVPPDRIHKLTSLLRDFNVESRQLRLYLEETRCLVNSTAPHGAAPRYVDLVLVKQPFPKPVKKNIRVCGADGTHEEPPVVRLLRGASVSLEQREVVAEVIYEEDSDVREMIGKEALDPQGYASFYNLKFSKANRKKVAKLKISVNASFLVDGERMEKELSVFSAPFIVFTNESQWEESEAYLLRRNCFMDGAGAAGDHYAVPFPWFANYLQLHFLRSTRQDPYHPDRALSVHDINYIAQTKFGGKKAITPADFDSFFEWFGKVLRKIRHKQNFRSIWSKGLVYGFIGRAAAERLLQGRPSGTFVVRFSEHQNGFIVITSVHDSVPSQTGAKQDDEDRVFRHFLVAPDKDRLLKVIRQIPVYKVVVKVNTQFTSDLNHTAEYLDKNVAFEEDYPKEEVFQDVQGEYILDNKIIMELPCSCQRSNLKASAMFFSPTD